MATGVIVVPMGPACAHDSPRIAIAVFASPVSKYVAASPADCIDDDRLVEDLSDIYCRLRAQHFLVNEHVVHPPRIGDDSRGSNIHYVNEGGIRFLKNFIGSAYKGLSSLVESSTIGVRFEELAYIIGRVEKKIPIGVCMDTCHTFAAGYDIRTKQALKATLDEFDRVIGLPFLRAMHLNDSEGDLGSHKDRHRLIGEGMIGKEGFSAIMHEPRLSSLPKYLETPGDLEIWQREIAWLLRQIEQRV